MVPVLNHEISEGANDPAQVNLYSGSKSHCKNIDHCQALHQIHCGRVLFSCCRVTENTVMKICISIACQKTYLKHLLILTAEINSTLIPALQMRM